jgi:hypothetical protein
MMAGGMLGHTNHLYTITNNPAWSDPAYKSLSHAKVVPHAKDVPPPLLIVLLHLDHPAPHSFFYATSLADAKRGID